MWFLRAGGLACALLAGASGMFPAAAESFVHKTGRFDRVGPDSWQELNAKAKPIATFKQLYADSSIVVVFDEGRKLLLRFMRRTGPSQWMTLDENGWETLNEREVYQP